MRGYKKEEKPDFSKLTPAFTSRKDEIYKLYKATEKEYKTTLEFYRSALESFKEVSQQFTNILKLISEAHIKAEGIANSPNFPQKVRELRKHLGVSQKAFAELLGVSLRTVQRWERGESKPSKLALSRLAQLFVEAKGCE